jgi:hypothetical protein
MIVRGYQSARKLKGLREECISTLRKLDKDIRRCAAEAIFCCPTENSRHLEA